MSTRSGRRQAAREAAVDAALEDLQRQVTGLQKTSGRPNSETTQIYKLMGLTVDRLEKVEQQVKSRSMKRLHRRVEKLEKAAGNPTAADDEVVDLLTRLTARLDQQDRINDEFYDRCGELERNGQALVSRVRDLEHERGLAGEALAAKPSTTVDL